MNINLFEDFLINNLPLVESFHPHYNEAMQKMLISGGKRFRPWLLLSVVDFYEPLLLKSSLSTALGIEYLHTYSLIHDDLPAMDNASMRRGTPTLHTQYDESLAILVGDGLNTEAFFQISNSPLNNDIKISLISELSNAGGLNGMVLGQALDLYFENKTINKDELLVLHTNKTAKLIAASLKMGAVIANLSFLQQQKIYDIGIELGILFQIQDDILDIASSKEESGKDVNQDSNKNSFITIFGLEQSMQEADKKIQKIQKDLISFDENFAKHIKEQLAPYLNRHKKKN